MTTTMRRRSGGFTLLELLVTLTIMLVAAALGAPALLNMVRRGKLETVAEQTKLLLRTARFAAITAGGLQTQNPDPLAPTVMTFRAVVMIDPANKEVFAFADLNDADGEPGSDLEFNPIPGAPYPSTDYELGRIKLGSGIYLGGPTGLAPPAPDAIEGLTEVPDDGSLPFVAAFIADGSVVDTGAIRFGDERGNYLEVRVAPRPTARVEMRKWDPALMDWRPQGQPGNQWEWYL